MWSGLGINIGNDINADIAYPTSTVTADLAYLKSLGFTHLRVALATYTDTGASHGVDNEKALAVQAKAAGFYVSWGVAVGGQLTATTMNGAYQTAVLAGAVWAQANSIDEFQIGNEIENNFDSGTLTELQIRNWVRATATTVKSNGYAGKVSYSVAGNHMINWVNDAAIGSLDYIAVNEYGEYANNWNLGFEYYVNEMLTVFTTSNFYVSEFNMYFDWPAAIASMSPETIAWQLDRRVQFMQTKVTRAYIFTWRFFTDQFALKLINGNLHPMWPALLQTRPWFNGISNVAVTRGALGGARGAITSRPAGSARPQYV